MAGSFASHQPTAETVTFLRRVRHEQSNFREPDDDDIIRLLRLNSLKIKIRRSHLQNSIGAVKKVDNE